MNLQKKLELSKTSELRTITEHF